ncbi:hypothetical protein [Paenibacillus sp. GP183]|jgi:hypothetical protein|uniref:hypothetical protein n=1 Tax=Paenibacillus sp. GP183 TaxID=1882751 RepID=UPI000897D92F|nr:hypothetical protein [Paenibacillus sp. GP183]SEB59167.1 hypothetical protein SAMN05443246_1231 [Paenibacillus sp. GP183]
MMNFTSQDIDIIEKALRSAMQSEIDERRNEEFREVLLKLQSSTRQVNNLLTNHVIESMPDGIRYDYDDSSDLH